ncbi:hypothetical protein BDV30DRAFT_233181 [Aspergillus minisclerotigenes]|uniref:Uncharacterized protein n=1 Tax=Aspergillus minisclerotigenes TaxID=656917 RepID=A0A5N6JNB8_9EURO|nr:hypothetical protein BDV30DRAFT_233181 [Aspergillus minisclerotigenes]
MSGHLSFYRREGPELAALFPLKMVGNRKGLRGATSTLYEAKRAQLAEATHIQMLRLQCVIHRVLALGGAADATDEELENTAPRKHLGFVTYRGQHENTSVTWPAPGRVLEWIPPPQIPSS